MNKLILTLVRDTINEDNTIGSLYANGEFVGYTLEDALRPFKIKGKTAIPFGFYKIVLSKSTRFGRVMLEILDVRGFSGIRIHGGNDEFDTDGCPLLGANRSSTNIWDCSRVNRDLIDLVGDYDECFISVVHDGSKIG
jgi:hypothetical protein